MGQHTLSEELLEILTASFVNIASFFCKSCFDLAEGENFPVAYLNFFKMSTQAMRFSQIFSQMQRKCLILIFHHFRMPMTMKNYGI